MTNETNTMTNATTDSIHNYSDCKNTIDFITQEEWTDDFLPEVKIKYFDFDPKKTPETICYKKDDILTLLNNPDNYVANWIEKEGETLSDEGYGGKPGEHILFKTLLNKYIVNPLFLKDDVDVPIEYFFAIPFVKNYRVGNRQGTFGISQIHGQAPGVTVYYIMPVQENMFSDNDTIKQYYTIINYMYQEGEIYEDEDNKNHLNQLEEQEGQGEEEEDIPILVTEYEYLYDEQHLYIEFNEIPENVNTIHIDMESYPEIIDYGLNKLTVFIGNNNQENLTLSFMADAYQLNIDKVSIINSSNNNVLLNVSSIENVNYNILNVENIELINLYINHYTKAITTTNTNDLSKELKTDFNTYFPDLKILSIINYKYIKVNTLSNLGNLKKLYVGYFEIQLDEFPQELIHLLDNNPEVKLYFTTVNSQDIDTIRLLPDMYTSRIDVEIIE